MLLTKGAYYVQLTVDYAFMEFVPFWGFGFQNVCKFIAPVVFDYPMYMLNSSAVNIVDSVSE